MVVGCKGVCLPSLEQRLKVINKEVRVSSGLNTSKVASQVVYKSKEVNTVQGKNHNSYERYLLRKKGRCNC